MPDNGSYVRKVCMLPKRFAQMLLQLTKTIFSHFHTPLSSPYFPSVMEWGGQGHSSVSTLSWRDSRQRVWSTSSRLSRPLVSRDPASSLMLYALLSLHSLYGPPYCFPLSCFVSGAKHFRVYSSSGSQKLAHGKSIT